MRRRHRERHGTARGRCSDDAGTALIEAGLVVPILTMLITGIVDFGVLHQHASVVYSATHSAARSASTAGSARSADFLALRAFNAGFASATHVTLSKAVIYKPEAEGSSDPISTTCFTSTAPAASAKCNVYSAAMVETIGTSSTAHFGPSATACGTTAWDRNWCPLTRADQQGAPTDWLGVYVELSFRSVTGFWLRSGHTFTDRVVMRIEPKPAAA